MHILLTRSNIDSIETSKILEKHFWNFTITPLLDIQGTKKKVVTNNNFDIVIFTSKNGIRYFNPKSFNKKIPVLTVGPGTKKLAEQKGFSKIINVDGELNKLKDTILNFLESGMKVVHPTFQTTNKDLENLINSMKCLYVPVKCYDARQKNVCPRKFKIFIRTIDRGIITLFSSRTAQSFYNEVKKFKLSSYCKNKKLVLLSEKIKSELKGIKFEKVFVTNRPNEDSMVETLKLINKEEY